SEDITRPGDYKVAGIVNFVTGGCAVKTGNANSHEWKNVTGKTANLFRAIYEPNKPGYSTTAGKPAASAHDLTDEESASVLSLFTVRLGNTEEDDVIEISDSDSSEISGPLFVNLGYPTVADNSFLPDFVITPENIGASHSYEDVTFLVNNGTYLNIDSDQKTEGITGGDYEPGTASSSFAGSILVRNGGRARVSAWNAWPFVDDSNVIVSAGGYLALGQGDRSGAIATDALESHTDLQDYYNGWFVGTSDNDKIRLNSPNSYIALNETSILLDGDATVNNDVSIARSFYLTGASTLTIADGVRFTFGNDLNYNQYTTKAFYGQPGAQIVISSDASVVDDSADNPSFGSSTTPVSTSTWIATNSSEEEPSWDTTLYGGTFYSSWSEQQENQVGENDPSTMEELVG
ncbi:MAG: hypothetical protein LBL35_07045, partial [Clostridiales bacterium]|nr:hypothetical protein [Clostridiales bacterium]